MRVAKIGLGKQEDLDLLVLHPRNNNDTLLIHLDEQGQLLRMSLLEVKAWMNIYSYYFDGFVNKGEIASAYEAIDLSLQTEDIHFSLDLLTSNFPNDAHYLKILLIKAKSVKSLYLNNVLLSNDGANRFSDLLCSCSNLESLHLESNYFDDLGIENIIQGLSETCFTLKSLKIVNNRLGDSLVQVIIDALAKEKNKKSSKPLECLVLSGVGVADSGLLSLQSLLSEYAHPPPGFSLDLSHNSITVITLLMISELLIKYPLVHYLNLSHCSNLNSVRNSAKPLLENLVFNKILTEIDFRGNSVGKDGYKSILSFAGNNIYINRFSADFNNTELIKVNLVKLGLANEVFRFYLTDPIKEKKQV